LQQLRGIHVQTRELSFVPSLFCVTEGTEGTLWGVAFPEMERAHKGLKILREFYARRYLGLLVVKEKITIYKHYFHDVEYTVS